VDKVWEENFFAIILFYKSEKKISQKVAVFK